MLKNNDKEAKKQEQPQAMDVGQLTQYINKKVASASNLGTATFSSMSKQAESLVNGGNSVTFNPYNNYLAFQWAAMNLADCLSVDIVNRSLLNINGLGFVNGGTLSGISDGFTVDDKGQIVQIYDPNVALSCAFGYKIQTEADTINGRLNIEIERRQLDYQRLLEKYKETDANAMHAESMIHYINFDLNNHLINFVIPYEDEQGEPSHGDTLPAETLEYGEIVPGSYNPSVGIDEIEKKNYSEKIAMVVSRDIVAANTDFIGSNTVYAMGGYVFPAFSIPVEGSTFKNPLGGEVVEIPTESGYIADILGGVRGDTVKNPNYGITRFELPEGHGFFNVENEEIPKDLEQSYYIGVNVLTSFAGQNVKITTETTPEAIEIQQLFGGIERITDPTRTTLINPNYHLNGYYVPSNQIFDTVNEFITLDKDYIYIDNYALCYDVYGTNVAQILGIAPSIELATDYLAPTVKAVADYVRDVSKAMMEVIAADFEAKQQLIELNAHNIDGIKNSCGGYETEYDEYCADSVNWRMWVFLRRWIIKAFVDSIAGKNGPEWEENLPSLKDQFDKYGFGPEWQAVLSLSGSGSEHSMKVGHEETTTRRDVCNLYVDGAASLGIVAGKDSYSGIYSHNWLVVHGYYDYKNSGVHFLCEGVAEFRNNVKFSGTVEGLDFAPTNHTHDYETITNRPTIYTQEETNNIITSAKNEIIEQMKQENEKLQNEITELNNKVNQLLLSIKDMDTYQQILFRLIDLTKDIYNIRTTCENLNTRIIALENDKGAIDTLTQNVVDLQAQQTTTNEKLTELDARVTALEGGA